MARKYKVTLYSTLKLNDFQCNQKFEKMPIG